MDNMDSIGNKENIMENPTPRRMTRLAKSLLMKEAEGAEGSVKQKDKDSKVSPVKTTRKVVTKTPKKTPKKTPGKSAQETPGSARKARSAKKDDKKATPGSRRVTRSRSILSEKDEEEQNANDLESSKRNLFRDDREISPLEEDFRSSKEEIEVSPDEAAEKSNKDSQKKKEVEEKPMDKEANKELKDNSTEENDDVFEDNPPSVLKVPEDVPKPSELESFGDLVETMKEEKDLGEESIVIVDDSLTEDNTKMSKNPSIIIIPDTPMPEKATIPLNETFSPEPTEIVFAPEEHKLPEPEPSRKTPRKTPKKTPIKTPKKSPKRLNLLSSTKNINFAPAIASSALKNSLLLENKILTPLKSIRKRSFSTTDVESSRKINRVKFHSPANMEITVDEIDDSMRPHIEEIKLERDAYVNARAKEKKLAKRRKRSMSNVETESGKRALLDTSTTKTPRTPTKKNESIILGKIPNFMAIHAASFKKMENLVDYKNRKDERAKNLLSSSGKVPSRSAAKEAVAIEKDASVAPAGAKVPEEGDALQKVESEGEKESGHVGTTSRPLNKVEERQQKWRSMHKSGRHDNQQTEVKAAQNAMLKGVRTNRRFELMMKFRGQKN